MSSLVAVGVVVVVGAGALLVFGLRVVNSRTGPPSDLGASGGRLAPLRRFPNAVSSQIARPAAAVAPLAGAGSSQDALVRLDSVLAAFPRATLVRSLPDYRHYTFTTAVCGFVDDVEFLLDRDASVIQVRSASRLGYSDLGANRRRIEAIRRAWSAK